MSELGEFEAGTTIQVTFVASVAPDGPPTLVVTDQVGTVVATATAVSSGDGSFFSVFATPDNPGISYYLATWNATKTFPGGAFPVVQRVAFRTRKTMATG